MNESCKVLITGGHITPALAMIKLMAKEKPYWKIIFAGRKFALEGKKEASEEYRIINHLKIKFYPIVTGRLQRIFTFRSLLTLLKFPIGLIQSIIICDWEKPDLILSFGGYIALPVVLAAKLFGIKIITHEQTMSMGLANKIISNFSDKVCLTFPDKTDQISSGKISVTGLPVDETLWKNNNKFPYQNRLNLSVIYITGGVTGSQSVNQLIYPILSNLLNNYVVVHQTGRINFDEAREFSQTLEPKLLKNYHYEPYLDYQNHVTVLKNAHLVIGRSGANTTAELAILGKVAILIPLPWSGFQEQKKNAQWLEEKGSVLVLDQNNLTPEIISEKISEIEDNYASYKNKSESISKSFPKNGAQNLLGVIRSLCGV